jgi:hypothetical protein
VLAMNHPLGVRGSKSLTKLQDRSTPRNRMVEFFVALQKAAAAGNVFLRSSGRFS